mmetsp:Transcript_21147/g.26888  ORF Transcript_21147/g.26888 Transcript_21147/m.26888 type:complete len:203 (-) Transcript_21147:18-626(-)
MMSRLSRCQISSINSTAFSITNVVEVFKRAANCQGRRWHQFRNIFYRQLLLVSPLKTTCQAGKETYGNSLLHIIHEKRRLGDISPLFFFSSASLIILQMDKTTVSMEENDNGSTGLDTNDDQDEDENCPFCQKFLSSPCRMQFREWRKCVKSVKEATECMEPFGPLLECMKSHGMIEEEGNENEASGENDVTSDNNKTSNKA